MATVFISHRTADLAEAVRLSDDLKTLGHTVWIDDDQVGFGDSIIGKMNEGLSGTAYLLLCMSSSGVDAPYTAREWMSYLAQQLNGKPAKLIPVLLTGTSVPAILADIKRVDLISDWAKGISDIDGALQ